jgi:hypothetical protein
MKNRLRPKGRQAFAQLVQPLSPVAAIDFQTSIEASPQVLESLLQEPNHRRRRLFRQTGSIALKPLPQALQAGTRHAVQSIA